MLLPRRLIKFGFHLLYNQLAFTYDTVAWLVSFGQWQAWTATSLQWIRGPRVLELGHGPGHLLVRLARSGVQPIGVDVSPNMLRMARRRLRRAGLSVPQVCVKAPALPFRSNEFDSVVATFPTEYLFQTATLCEVRRVLKDDGRLIIVVGATLGRGGATARLIDWLYTITGQREMAADDEASVFEQAGLTVQVETQTVGRSEVTLLLATPAQAG
jgi:ubiquinone/menaquinone biosynthesis C-methylase UbiE